MSDFSQSPDAYYDAAGNMERTSGGIGLIWKNGTLREARLLERDGEPNDRETYCYNAGWRRAQKSLSRKVGGQMRKERVAYLPGLEIRSKYVDGSRTELMYCILSNNAIIQHWTGDGKPQGIDNNLTRFSLYDATNGVNLELDGGGNILSREEYYPYGGTSVWSARSQIEADYKVIRYSGKERDRTGQGAPTKHGGFVFSVGPTAIPAANEHAEYLRGLARAGTPYKGVQLNHAGVINQTAGPSFLNRWANSEFTLKLNLDVLSPDAANAISKLRSDVSAAFDASLDFNKSPAERDAAFEESLLKNAIADNSEYLSDRLLAKKNLILPGPKVSHVIARVNAANAAIAAVFSRSVNVFINDIPEFDEANQHGIYGHVVKPILDAAEYPYTVHSIWGT